MKVILSHAGVRVAADSRPGDAWPVVIKAGTIKDSVTRDQARVLVALLVQALRLTDKPESAHE